MAGMANVALTRFSMRRPPHRIDQRRALDWLVAAHAESQATVEGSTPEQRAAFTARLSRLIDRCDCGPGKVAERSHVLADIGRFDFDRLAIYDVTKNPHGKGTAARAQLYSEIVDAYFEAEYGVDDAPPSDLIHVTCTGYVSPSGAQRVVMNRGWGATTRVTHAYHMGCHAAFPAIRIAVGHLEADAPRANRRVDVVHTELCSLHLDPSDHSIEQLAVQSLFADGLVRYSVGRDDGAPGLRVLALDERLVPGSTREMTLAVSDWGMKMTLGRNVSERVAGALRDFVADLYRRAGTSLAEASSRAVFAVHPAGPRIIDRIRDVLELSDEQVRASREVLYERGNMSSATLPHVWMRIVDDPRVARGTPVVSLAFGPGLTLCGGVFEKR